MPVSRAFKPAQRLAWLACAIALMAGGTAAAAETPMLDCGGLPCAKIQIADGKTLTLAVDTGNSNTVLDLARAKALGLVLSPLLDREQKPRPGLFTTTLSDVRLAGEHLGDLKVLVADLSPSISNGTFPSVDGALSYAALKNRRLVLDYRRHTVGVLASAPDAPCGSSCGAISYPTFGKRGPPIVVTTGYSVNDQPVTMQVDTMYAGNLMIYSASIDKLHLRDAASRSAVRYFPYTDGGVDMIVGKVDKEAFGIEAGQTDAPIYFPTAKVHQPDGMFDGTVGKEAFLGRVVNLDFGTNQFWLS